ncbi:YuzF family protein [Lysinibacillus sp. MHQ-1]|nr:YuzF family protein [Lysinibacillus sp. MHQ-1]
MLEISRTPFFIQLEEIVWVTLETTKKMSMCEPSLMEGSFFIYLHYNE